MKKRLISPLLILGIMLIASFSTSVFDSFSNDMQITMRETDGYDQADKKDKEKVPVKPGREQNVF